MEEFIKEKEYYTTLNLKIEEIISDFQKKIQDRLKESLEDITINISKLEIEHIKVNTTNYKFAANVTLGVISTALGTISLLATKYAFLNAWNPTGWIAGSVAVALTGIGALINLSFDSKETKIKKAVEKIINTIQPKIEENEKKF